MNKDEFLTAEKILGIFQNLKSNEKEIRKQTLAQRKMKLKKLLSAVEKFSPEIEKAIFEDFRKSPAEVRLTEIFMVTTEIKHAIRNLKNWTKPTLVPTPLTLFGSSSKIIYEPKGIVLIISPWNYPFQLAIGPLISAISAGNGVIIKPSEHSPNTSKIIKKMIESVFSPNEIAVIEGDAKISEELLNLPFDHIFFTGSTKIGKIVMEKAAKNLTSVTLELGGKSPVIVDKNYNLKEAAQRIAWGKLINAGQTCIAPDYLIIPSCIEEVFVKQLKENVEKMYGKIGTLQGNGDFCRIINPTHANRLKELLDDAIEKGAKIQFGGKIGEDNFFEPTVLTNVSLDSKIMKEEIFGPILPILNSYSYEEIVEIANKNPKPLALYIFSNDKKFINDLIHDIPSGGTAINDVVVHFVNYNLPFGGINSSGIGSSHGEFGFKTFSHHRSVMKQPKFTSLKMFYPPYSKFVEKMIDLTIRYF